MKSFYYYDTGSEEVKEKVFKFLTDNDMDFELLTIEDNIYRFKMHITDEEVKQFSIFLYGEDEQMSNQL